MMEDFGGLWGGGGEGEENCDALLELEQVGLFEGACMSGLERRGLHCGYLDIVVGVGLLGVRD